MIGSGHILERNIVAFVFRNDFKWVVYLAVFPITATNIIITGKKCPTSTTQSVLWHANLALYVGVLSELDWYLYVCIAANKKFFFRDISYLSQILEASESRLRGSTF